MKTHKVIGVLLGVIFIAFVIAGCQPEQEISQQQEVAEQQVEPVEADSDKKLSESTPPQTETKAVEDGKTPKIVVKKEIYDFGKVGPKSKNKAHYEFVNEGEGVLTIKQIHASCGCSEPTLIKGGKRYPARKPLDPPVAFGPGEEGEVEVIFTPSSTKGAVSKNLYILSDDPLKPRSPLTVKAEVVVNVDITPEQVELRLDKDNAGMPDLVVESTDDKEFSITSIRAGQSVMTFDFDPQEKAKKFILKSKVDLEKLGKFSSGVIQIKTTHPQAGDLIVRYVAKPMFTLSNPRYSLRYVEPETPIIRDNLIKSNYGKPAEIESIESKNGYMEIVDQIPDGNHIKLSVKITPPSHEPGSKRFFTDELTLTLKGGHKLSIRCSGWFRLNKQ